MLDEGIWAEVKVGGEHLQLFAEHNALGVQASVYNVKAKNWIAPSEPVKDIQYGKAWAMARAEAYLKRRQHRTASFGMEEGAFEIEPPDYSVRNLCMGRTSERLTPKLNL